MLKTAIVHDMNDVPRPFNYNLFEEMVSDDVIEHSNNFLEIIDEIYRVNKNSCLIKISVPHYSSDNMYTDQHTQLFS